MHLIGIGYSYLDKNKFDNSLLQFNLALEIESDNIFALKGKTASLIGEGNKFIKIKEYDKALGIFEEALKIEPNNPDAIIGNIKSTSWDWERKI